VRRTGVALVALVMSVASAACTTHDLAFRKDHRVKIVAPASQSTQTLPVNLRWTSKNLFAGATFAVFVDRQPMGPGHTLRSIADDDCKRQAGCPNAAWLADHHIYLTKATSLRLETLPADNKGERYGAGHGHEITIVLLNDRGTRQGEAAFATDFSLKKAA
jgi:hypothetical protein